MLRRLESGPANWRAPARPVNERGLFHTIENTTIYLRRTADDDNASRFGLQTEYPFHRRAPIDTLCDTNNKTAKLIARNIFFAKVRDNDGRSWKELLQQLPGGSQVTYVDKDDEGRNRVVKKCKSQKVSKYKSTRVARVKEFTILTLSPLNSVTFEHFYFQNTL